jgi:LCP family protein required for cell wall assembly
VSDELRPRSTRSKKLGTIARHGRLRRSNPFVNVARALAVSLAVLLVSGASVAAIATIDVATSAQEGVPLANDAETAEVKIDAIPGGVNLLVVGSDSRKGQDAAFGPEDSTGDLNDVTMLLHISEDHTNASVISFPRDMYVPIPECPDPEGGTFNAMSRQKINTTLAYGGLACTVLTVEKLTGLNIPYAAEVQFSGVMAMSSAVGGVPVCVAEDIEDEYTNTYLTAGMHTLEGLEALQFLRTRHGVGDGSDLTRISNQQVFMSSLVRTVKSASTLSDPIKVYSLAKAVTANMNLSTSLNDVSTLASIAVALKDIDLSKVVFAQVPTGHVEGGVIPSQPDFDDLFEAIAADDSLQLAADPTPEDPTAEDPTAEDPAAAPDASATTDPAAPAPDPAAEPPTAVLSDSVEGQTAGDVTCSAGRTLDQQ